MFRPSAKKVVKTKKFRLIFKKNNLFSCPQQLNRTPCPLLGRSVGLTKLTIRHYRVTLETCDLWDIWSEWPPHLNGLLNYALVVANTNFHFLKPMLIPRQGDLFLYGTEALICPINRKGSWVGCLGWQRGRARTFFLSIFLRSFFR